MEVSAGIPLGAVVEDIWRARESIRGNADHESEAQGVLTQALRLAAERGTMQVEVVYVIMPEEHTVYLLATPEASESEGTAYSSFEAAVAGLDEARGA